MSKPYNRFHMPNFQLDSLLFGCYVKYDKLSQLIYNEFGNKPEGDCTHVNIFIDLYSIMRSICFREDFKVDPGMEYSLASRAINMAAHYREYFRTRHQCTTNIYIISSFNMNDNTTRILSEYKSKIYLSRENGSYNYFVENIKVLNSLVPYLPGIYFRHYDYNNTSAAMMDIMNYNVEHGNTNPNIVITKDVVTYQLVNFDKALTICIRPKKTVYQDINGSNISEDSSYSINKDTLMYTYGREKTMNTKDSDIVRKRLEKISQLSPELLSAFLTFTGIGEYNLASITRFPTTLNDFYKIFVEEQFLLNKYNNDIEYLIKMIQGVSSGQKANINPKYVLTRFSLLDLYSNYYSLVYNNIERYVAVEDLYQPDMVKDINNQFFTSCPLDLNVL